MLKICLDYLQEHCVGCVLQARAACKHHDAEGQRNTVLKSMLLHTCLLQFAAEDSIGVMACVSLSKRLKGPIASFICQVDSFILADCDAYH